MFLSFLVFFPNLLKFKTILMLQLKFCQNIKKSVSVAFDFNMFIPGEWVLVIVYLAKEQIQECFNISADTTNSTSVSESEVLPWKLQNLHIIMFFSVTVSFIMYYGLGGGLQYYYYIKRREQSKEWKCQPDRFLTPENERHEILLGSFNMLLGSMASGVIACYVLNGGYTTLYYDVSERGWLFLVLSSVGFYMYTDTFAYYIHRLFHYPYLYKKIHKVHHRYHQPTAFGAVAMHPVEFLLHQSYLAAIPFFYPIHVASFIGILLYTYYYGMIDHSGIKMEAVWPWQPNTMFHDDHHRYFHCNFGFNSYLFDWLHGTLRVKEREYGENIFGGFGRETTQKIKKSN